MAPNIVTGSGKTIQSYEDWKKGGESSGQIVTQSGNAVQSYDDWKRSTTISRKGFGSDVDDLYINNWIKDTNGLFSGGMNNRLTYGSANSPNGNSASAIGMDDLFYRANAIKGFLLTNRDTLTPDSYQALMGYVTDFERNYKWYEKYRGSGYEDVEKYLAHLPHGEERDWLEANQYSIYTTAPNYMDRAQAGLYAFENSKPKNPEEESWFEAVGRYLGKVSDTTMALGDTGRMVNEYRRDTSYMEPADNWTEDQRNTYGYLYSINPEIASDYAVNLSESYRSAENEQKLGAVQEWATKNGKNATAATVAAIAMMPLSLADTLNALTEYNARGTISTPSTPTPGQVSEAITGAVGQNLNDKYGTINEEIPVLGGKGWGDAYQLGISIANSLLSAYTQGSVGTTAVFFGSAASSTMHSAKDRGYTDEQAIKLGVAAGLAEAAGEAFSIDKLLNIKDPKTLVQFFAYVLKQGGIEASEEFNTTVLNNIAEQWIMGDKSAFYEKVQVYMTENGMSEEEAKIQAWKDYAEDAAFDAFGGFISGGFSSGIQIGSQKIFGDTQQAQTHHEPLATDKDSLTTELANSEEKATTDKTEAVAEESSGTVAENATTTSPVTLESLSEKYGDRAADMRKTFMEGQDIEEYDRAFQMAYDMGKAGVSESFAQRSEATSYLSDTQRSIAYNMGVVDAASAAKALAAKNAAAANGKTGWHKGTVKGQGVKIADMSEAFNDPQRKAYGYLSNIAEVTGVDIVLYKSEVGQDGKFQGEQGKFKWKDDTIYIDINAGLKSYTDAESLAEYTMMRTFDHEFTHFIEKRDPEGYNEFRRMVFETMEANGADVESMIDTMISKSGGSLTYDQAAREVIAEAMTDILPETSFIEQLAKKNQNIFQQLLSKLKEFLTSIKQHFSSMGDGSKEARALKRQLGETVSYMEEIVKKFDEIAVKAVENYQRTVAEDTTVSKTDKVDSKTEKTTPDNRKTDSDNEKAASDNRNADPVTTEYRSEHGFTIRTNAEYGSLEITFDSKPSQSVRDALKDNKFRWNGKKGVWYGKTDQKTIVDALNQAYQQEVSAPVDRNQNPMVPTSNTTVEDTENTESLDVKEPVTEEPADVYDELRSVLKVSNSTEKNGYRFAVDYTPGANVHVGSIQRVENSGGYPVSNARNRIYTGSAMKDRNAAIDDLVAVAKNNKLLDPVTTPVQSETKPQKTVTKPAENGTLTPSEKLADQIIAEYLSQKKPLTAKELYAMADTAFGGTQAEGAYNRKDAYDAMELAVNKHLLTAAREFNGDQKTAVDAVKYMQDLLELLPTQSVRTQEQQDFQQFSTPPNIAYLAAWAANINAQDSVLEPSAGIGGLAVFAKAWGAEVAVNELSKRRLEVLRAMGFDHLFNENAEQIDNILPENISPSVVIMNPPFSSTAGRTKNNKTSNAEKHIDQALMRLQDGGRLVAILGKGMNDADYYKYWDKLRKTYSIRANLSIDGNNYKKYGTTWGVQIVVIDKTGAQTGETVTGSYTDLTEVPGVLEGIRNDRSNVEKGSPASNGNPVGESVADGGNAGNSDTGHSGSSERTAGSAAQPKRKSNRKMVGATQAAADRTHGETAAETGSEAVGSQDGGTDRTAGRTDPGDGTHANGSAASNQHESELPQQGLTEQEEVSDDGVYATFVLPDIPVKGSRKHPAVLVESAAMAAVSMPKATYVPKLPADVVKNNLSDAQMVTVTYAGQAHEQKLPDGRRKGFFIGDGTGVGKGRQIAGIILDNFMQGRDKAVWISKNDDLYGDAVRDWTQTTGRSKDEIVSQGKFKPKDSITMQSGILFTSYGKLKMEKGGNRLDQIVQWLGKDFDGVIAFDEAHFMGNLYGKKGKFGKAKGSLTAKAGVELQRQLPNARIVYVSATAATEVDNLAYAERLGLWGQGTAFNNAQDFIAKIGSSGLAAMELVIRDMKAMGSYVARSISYNGVNYDTVEHTLDPMQMQIYDTMSRAWQKTMSNVQSALITTGGRHNSAERQRAVGNFYSSMQRFYNQVLTSMAMPSVIADMRKELAAGHSCVMQIVNTNEAQQNKQLAEAKAKGESLDNLDMTPREALIGYLNTSFPTQLFEEYTDEDGNLRSRPVLDSKGNPVQSKEAVRQRDALIAEVNQMSIPDGPLEMLFDAFGTEAVAENTGRSRRVVPKKQEDGSITRVEERRSLNHRTADVQAFQDGKKRILVFSDAGGTGKSYHAALNEKNQQQRVHYVLQPGWVASNAVQGFGRTHRSNEASAPVYKLVTTNIKGQKRFTSTIARRLDQLGALTKGQRDTGSGMFGAKDNLETDLAKDSLREFYKRLGKNQIEGIDGMKTLDRLGLKQKFTDEYGAFKLNDALARDISTFLNRILSLEVDEQNTVFDAFISIYEMELEAAIQAGTLDTGMENVKADKIEVVDDKVIREDKNSGAATHYIQAKTYTKPKVVTTVAEISNLRSGFEGLYKTESGAVKAVFRIADKTTEWGAIQKQYRLVGPNQGARNSVWGEATLKTKAKAIDKADWQKEWDAEVAKVPEYNEDTVHMLTGALLPIWNSLPQEGSTKVKRLIAEDGSVYLGRVINKDMIDGVLRSFAIGRTMEVFTGQQVMDKAIQNGVRFQLTNDRVQIYRSRVSGEWRLEVFQPHNAWYLTRRYPGIIQERISYRDRFFIPVGEKGIPILEKLLKDNPVRSTMDEEIVQYQSRDYLEDDNYDLERIPDRAWEDHSSGLAGRENSASSGRNSSQKSPREVWKALGTDKQGQIADLIETYSYFSDEAALYIGTEEGATMKMAEAFYTAMQGNRTLLENDGRFRWLGDMISLFIQDVEAIEAGTYSFIADEEEYQLRTERLSDREVLARAADNLSMVDMTEKEKNALEIFRDRLTNLEELQNKRLELGRLYKEQQFGPNVDRAAAAETLDKMHAMDARIREANSKVLEVEEKGVLSGVLKEARKVVEKAQKDHDDLILKRWRDRRNDSVKIKKKKAQIQRDVKAMTDWALNPSGKDAMKHIPDALKDTVLPFLASIDFTSKRQTDGGKATKADTAFMQKLQALQNVLTTHDAQAAELYSQYDLPPAFFERLNKFISAAQGLASDADATYLINKMTLAELEDLYKIVSGLKTLITNFNKFHANAMFQHVSDAGDSSISDMAAMKADSGKNLGTRSFLFWQHIRPAYAWERFGKGGKAIYDGLRQGQARLAFNAKTIMEFAEKAYTAKEVQDWGKETVSVELESGETVKLTVAAVMSFYELSKRNQALQHMLGGGIRVASYKQKGHVISDEGHLITLNDLNRIIEALTPRQKEVADQIQKFMEEVGGSWGNYVSMKRFGEKLFGEEHYFPINSDGRHLQTTADEKGGAGLYSLLNMGFTKQLTPGAKNRIILYNIFDVFANHMASMAQYNAMALPVLDAVKWFNYQQKGAVEGEVNGKTVTRWEVEDSVRDQLARVFGAFEDTRVGSGKKSIAESFVLNILRGYNGTEAQGSPMDSWGLKALHRYNRAQVAYNLRVVIQQPLAITRAGMLVSHGSILRGMKLNPKVIQRNIQEMQKYSGIAAWKSLGFYDVNISRGLTSMIKHDETTADRFVEKGMTWAEKADEATWAAIWSACKEEVLRKGMKYGEQGFFDAVTALFEDVIYKTQVVDSILTKSEFMRDKGTFARATGSFMSEPTTTASMLLNAYDQYHMDMQRGMSRQQAWKKNRRMIGRTAYVYGVSTILLAAVTAVMDAFRDDDEYEEYGEKWWEAFVGNFWEELSPFNKLPIISDFWEVGKELLATFTDLDVYGNAPQSLYMQWYDTLAKGAEIIHDKITGEDTSYTWYAGAYKLLQTISGISGLPLASLTRDVITGWNNIIGAMAPSLKVKSYDPGDMSNIKYAYLDNYLTEDEAVAELLNKGLVENEDEAYWQIRSWDSGSDDFSRYDDINAAVRSGASIEAEMGELTSHGYTEEDVYSHIKSSIGKWYQDGEITKQQAIDMLKKYSSLTSEEITEAVNRWSCKVVTGIAFDDIKDQYMSGDLTQSKAAEMYVRYGGYTKEKAAEIVSVWAFVKKHPECDGITAPAVSDYTTYCEKAGVPAKTFYSAWKYKNTLSGTVKAPMMDYINGLNLSRAQKDSLYYAFGWAESTIDEAPWH